MNQSAPELLCPAGDMERLQTALTYGADAVYLGGNHLSLRSKAKGFSHAELIKAINLSRKHSARVYYCLNALPLQKDIHLAEAELEKVSLLRPDALIIADPGVVNMARHIVPDLDIHLSTQANTCNIHSINFWKNLGIKRVNLSRELGSRDIKDISRQASGIELELFVHGAMCMAISGRCFLSAHLNNRSANQGLCAHPCRYKYRPFAMDLEEKTRPGYPVWTLEQEEDHSKIFSAEDLCLVKYIPWFVRNRIHSLKIEGRTKSVSYIALVTDVYRTAINDFAGKRFRPGKYLEEISQISTRPMGTGFFLKNRTLYTAPQKANLRSRKILARVLQKIMDNKWLIQVKEKWSSSQNIELILPGLNRPVISADNYLIENQTGQKASTVHSGINAVLCCEHELIRENIFIRTGL